MRLAPHVAGPDDIHLNTTNFAVLVGFHRRWKRICCVHLTILGGRNNRENIGFRVRGIVEY